MLDDIITGITQMGNLASFVTLAITILGAVSLFLANMGRYLQAKKYGIPIRAVHQANIADSADLWIAFVGALGFGIFVPIVMLNVSINRWLLLAVMFISFVLGFLSTKNTMHIGRPKKVIRNGNEYTIIKSITAYIIAVIALISATVYLRLHNVYNDVFIAETGRPVGFFATLGTIVSAVLLGISVLLLLMLLFSNIRNRLLGSGDVMTTDINGQSYFIIMRHSTEKWILMPCDIEHYEKALMIKGHKYGGTEVKNIFFIKGSFIIKDLSELPEAIIYRTFFDVVEKGERKENN